MSVWTRVLLSAVLVPLALYETWDAYMFFNTGIDIPGSGIARLLRTAFVYTHPVFAVIAFLCALTGRVRWAIIAMAGGVLARCLWFLPGPTGSLESSTLFALEPTLKLLVIPALLAICALVLAKRNAHLWLATLLVAVPVIYSNWEMALFAIAVTIYGA